MKAFYENTEIEIVEFDVEDIITTSAETMGTMFDAGEGGDIGDGDSSDIGGLFP